MFRFKYRYCKTHMAKYLSGDLPDATRQRIARFINERQDCYDEFARQRAVAEQLRSSLPALGKPDARRLDSIWLSLSAELAPAHPGNVRSAGFQAPGMQTVGYTAILLLLGVALALPIVLGMGSSLGAVDLQRSAQMAELAAKPEANTGRRQPIAAATPSSLSLQDRVERHTPSPRFVR